MKKLAIQKIGLKRFNGTQFEIYYTNYSVYLQNIKASMLL